MPSINQFAYVPNSTYYQFAYGGSIPNMAIVNLPSDANLARWTMLNDGQHYRFYCFKGSTNDTLYQAAFNPATGNYEYGFQSIPELKITGAPADADASSVSMLYDGSTNTYRLYLRRLGDATVLYQFGFNPATNHYEYGHNSIPVLHVTGAPADTDFHRWSMLFDGSVYRLYAFKVGSVNSFYQFGYNPQTQTYQYGHESIPVLNLEGTPSNSNLTSMALLYGQGDYRFYFQTL
ncbi:hypothetical protein [Jeongeupia naejangsanensis]|uniref:Uncharacterized protein n=1 Tax=Jeongeupia naejangsanensis TaxID=613195 RepID=A0ABS2BPA0_9NEIS|nr:hypothetical protein [Jeongeupia naejangsanensis]MBM3117245.1 hypothetical protein [Jeongeupia naejangsanensis]